MLQGFAATSNPEIPLLIAVISTIVDDDSPRSARSVLGACHSTLTSSEEGRVVQALQHAVERIEELPVLLGKVVETSHYLGTRRELKRVESALERGVRLGIVYRERREGDPTYRATESAREWLERKQRQLGMHRVRSCPIERVVTEIRSLLGTGAMTQEVLREALERWLCDRSDTDFVVGVRRALPAKMRRAIRQGVTQGWLLQTSEGAITRISIRDRQDLEYRQD